jgi:hypothetical protein
MDNEMWKPIKGYIGLYEVSNLGRVKSLSREYTNSKGERRKVKESIRTLVLMNGYLKITIYKGIKPKDFRVHRLVAEAFKRNLKNKPYVNHKNGIKTDNRAINLEWCTAKENSAHAHKYGLAKNVGENHNKALLTISQVIEICELLDGEVPVSKIASKFKVNNYVIHGVRLGKTWNHLTNRRGKFKPSTRKGAENNKARAVINCRGEIFITIQEASTKYGPKQFSNISANCRGVREFACRYEDGTPIKWEYYKGED